ncbi:MAG: protein kinase [Cytophagales bacterium]|nr:protein kinase [Armatimonadota bacterium]
MQQPQQTLGRYQIVREIARSNDVVYEALDPTMNRRVAVKELALTASLVGEARRQRIERFYREARAAGAMSHPNIVTIYEVGEDRGRYFIAMEYLEGGTLREKLSLSGALPLSEALKVGIALCDALDYAHHHGIVHRDIKPDNVHLLPGGRVKLTDFGIARIAHEEQLTVAGQVFGTPSYMSPEQILGGQIDARTDIFSLGVLLYEMTTGRKPFTQPGDSVITITYRITHDPPPVPTGVPYSIESAFDRALSKDPAGRYATAADFRAALVAATGQASDGMAPPASSSPGTPTPVMAPQVTLQYGAQTQMGVAPGLAASGGAPPLASPPSTTLPPVPVSSHYPASEGLPREERSRRIAVTMVTLIIGLGVLTGGGWALSRAYENYQGQSALSQVTDRYKAATALYSTGKYQQAAEAFRRLRTSGTASSEITAKAAQGEVYAYRQLAHTAQEQNDFAAAVRWYREAMNVDPSDPQVREEMDAAQRRFASTGGIPQSGVSDSGAVDGSNPLAPLLSPSPSPAAPGGMVSSIASPLASALPPALPTVSANEYAATNARAANDALTYYQQGESAFRQGNRTAAVRYWTAAVAAGPGSPGALQAQERITQNSSNMAPY